MNHHLSAVALVLTLAACSGGGDAGGDGANGAGTNRVPAVADTALTGDSEAAMEELASADSGGGGAVEANALRRIPAPFRGTWAKSADDCDGRNFNRLSVSGDRISFFEDGGIASDIRSDGDALAVTYPFENPAGETERRVVYFARQGDGRLRVRRGDGDSEIYRRCGTVSRQQTAQGATTVPVRFRGLYAPDARACAEDYTYQPAFQRVRIGADEVSFFETGGPVTNVDVEGEHIAITLRERIGDTETLRDIYLALTGEGTARYRPGDGEPVRQVVRCPAGG
ncbi:hypothetical protein [Aurantiacibacter spongiae]|uniref:C-type lysozyme inhibitor domain-containing protein n=1 Tax=Aurantiacibacter spongiae TaxID=2488860 RepID=A0A3N5CWB5_9SPHN|nr:hypothetical protein [Aurantiacibacter spongiae]RPF71830.1 hypothetical protein EG799_09515 [Aurantiacibacter spongiae]